MLDNPFDYNMPAKPGRLVGREALVREVAEDLVTSSSSFAILGGRRCGKSSTLRAIQAELLTRRAGGLPRERRPVPVAVSLQALGEQHRQSADALHAYLREELSDAVRKDPWAVELGVADVVRPSSERVGVRCLIEAVVGLAHALNDRGVAARVVLLVDELNCVLGRSWTETFFENLRHVLYDSDATGDVAVVVAGTPRCLDTQERGSPLFNVLEKRDLDAVEGGAIRRLAAMGPALGDGGADGLLRAVGGSPYLAQYVLHHLARAPGASLGEVASRARRERDAEFTSWWAGIGALGRRVYRELDGGAWHEHADLARRTGRTVGEVERALRLLRLHHLARQREDFAAHQVAGDVFRAWVQAQGDVSIDAPEDRRVIARALLDAFTGVHDWEMLVRYARGANVFELATGNLREIAESVVECAWKDRWLLHLLDVALELRPGNPNVRQLFGMS